MDRRGSRESSSLSAAGSFKEPEAVRDRAYRRTHCDHRAALAGEEGDEAGRHGRAPQARRRGVCMSSRVASLLRHSRPVNPLDRPTYSPHDPTSPAQVDAAITMVQSDPPAASPSRFKAAKLHRGLQKALWCGGCRSRREFKVELLGDRDGRIDLLVTEPFVIAIGLDRRRPRRKSIRKLRAIEGVRFIVLGQPRRRPAKCPEGIDAVLGARPHPWVARHPTARTACI